MRGREREHYINRRNFKHGLELADPHVRDLTMSKPEDELRARLWRVQRFEAGMDEELGRLSMSGYEPPMGAAEVRAAKPIKSVGCWELASERFPTSRVTGVPRGVATPGT